LASIADLVAEDEQPDVWLFDGHGGDPGVCGPVVVSRAEVNWGRREFGREHDPDLVRSKPSTSEGYRRLTTEDVRG
jgi:hypothetical protein